MKHNQTNGNQEKRSLLIKPFSEMHKGALLYYILSFVVLFFKIFTLKLDNLSGETYRLGILEFAYGIGWIYYLVNVVGILTVITPLLGFLQNLGTKVISIVNLVISGLLLFKTIPDAIRPTDSIFNLISQGEIGLGFWLIMGLHIIAVLIFWFLFIRRISKKRDAKHEDDFEEFMVKEEVHEKQEHDQLHIK